MRLPEDHLNPNELTGLKDSMQGLAIGTPAERALYKHLRQCPECSALAVVHATLKTVGGLSSRPVGEACPSETEWLELVAGLHPEVSQDRLSHASECGRCAASLRTAIQMMGSDVQEAGDAAASAQSDLRYGLPEGSGSSRTSLVFPSRFSPAQRIWRRILPIAAVLLVSVLGAIAVWRTVHPSEAKLLALAYNKQRRIELRIPGGDPVSLFSGTRADGEKPAPPSELLELRLRAQQNLDRTPNSPYWHQILGEILILERDGLAARRNLEIAQAGSDALPNLSADLAAAWFEIGERSGDMAAYAQAAELYSQQLQKDPKGAAILYYNRALCWRRQSLNSNALADLRSALGKEPDAGWKKLIEAEIADLSSAPRISHSDGYEKLLAMVTETELLRWSESPEARDRIVQASRLGVRHQDHWLSDWIAASHTGQTKEADLHLVAAIKAVNRGEAATSLVEAQRAEEAYRKAGHRPGFYRARLAESYANQRLGRPSDCESTAQELLSSPIDGYGWMKTQALLEKGTCGALSGDFLTGGKALEEGAEMSASLDLPALHLRAIGFQAASLDLSGLSAAAWQANALGLRLCGETQCSPTTRYQFVHNMVLAAGRIGLQNVAVEIVHTAAELANDTGDAVFHAYAVENVATVEGMAGNYSASTRAFSQALELARQGKRAALSPMYQAEWQTDQAMILTRQRSFETSLQMLHTVGPTILASNYSPLRLQYFTQLADVQRSLGRLDEAIASASSAIQEAEASIPSLHSAADRERWTNKNAGSYAELVRSLLEQGQDERALEVWEQFRRAPYRSGPAVHETVASKLPREVQVLVLSRLTDEYVGWLIPSDPSRGIHAVRLGKAEKLVRQATTFYRLCSDSDSRLVDVQHVGGQLYLSLIQPFAAQIDRSHPLWIDVDPSLAMLPFSALWTKEAHWMGTSFSVVLLPAWWTNQAPAPNRDGQIGRPLRISMVDGFGRNSSAETATLARSIEGTTLLQGENLTAATMLTVLQTSRVFHFSGHASLESTPSLVLGSSGRSNFTPELLGETHLEHCEIAVLAACNTSATDPDAFSKLPSMREALLRAGAQNVVASNWDVDDRSTKTLMLEFYRSLAAGQSVPAALTAAQQAAQSNPTWQHPYFWAPFEVFSN